MIKVDEKNIQIVGDTTEILNDFANIVKGMRQSLSESYNDEIARIMISDMGRVAFADDPKEELKRATAEINEKLDMYFGEGEE